MKARLTQHPLSAAFPAMQADEYQALLDSILEIGVQNPITLLDGMVIDGWHRYTAANEAGVDCPAVELGDVDPKDFVMAQNKARRHITAAQMGLATTAVYAWRSNGQNQYTENRVATECPPSKSNAQLAEIAGVGVATIKQAKAVQANAAPEVVDAVRRGEVGLPKAAAIARLPIAEQAAALHKPVPKAAKPAPVVEPEADAPPDYSELDAAYDNNSALLADNDELRTALALASMGNVPEEEKQQAAKLIAELRDENKSLSAEVKTLTATLKAACLSRDSLMEERVQMQRQMAMQRKEIDKLKNGK